MLFHNGVTVEVSHSERVLEDARKLAQITNEFRSLTDKTEAVILIEHFLLSTSRWVDIHFLQH